MATEFNNEVDKRFSEWKMTPAAISKIAPDNIHPDFLDQVASQLKVEMQDLKYLKDMEVKQAFLKWNKKYLEVIDWTVGRQEVTEVSNIAQIDPSLIWKNAANDDLYLIEDIPKAA